MHIEGERERAQPANHCSFTAILFLTHPVPEVQPLVGGFVSDKSRRCTHGWCPPSGEWRGEAAVSWRCTLLPCLLSLCGGAGGGGGGWVCGGVGGGGGGGVLGGVSISSSSVSLGRSGTRVNPCVAL